VFLIVGENTSLSEVTTKRAPFITRTLRPAGRLADPVLRARGRVARQLHGNDPAALVGLTITAGCAAAATTVARLLASTIEELRDI
jgi:hypothetical protein